MNPSETRGSFISLSLQQTRAGIHQHKQPAPNRERSGASNLLVVIFLGVNFFVEWVLLLVTLEASIPK